MGEARRTRVSPHSPRSIVQRSRGNAAGKCTRGRRLEPAYRPPANGIFALQGPGEKRSVGGRGGELRNPEDVLEAVAFQKDVHGRLAKAAAAPRRQPEALGVQLGHALLRASAVSGGQVKGGVWEGGGGGARV